MLLNENNIDNNNKLIEFIKDIKSIAKTVFKKGYWDYLDKTKYKNYFKLKNNLKEYKVYNVISILFDYFKYYDSLCINFIITYKCGKHLPQGEIIK